MKAYYTTSMLWRMLPSQRQENKSEGKGYKKEEIERNEKKRDVIRAGESREGITGDSSRSLAR